MINFNDTIGNRTRDLPAFIAVPHPTAPARSKDIYNFFKECISVNVTHSVVLLHDTQEMYPFNTAYILI